MDNQHQSSKVSFIQEELSPFGFNSSASQLAGMSEEFRAIKRAIFQHAFQKEENTQVPNKNRVMVTSLHEQEGKTFTALNLARSVSLEQDKNILLVDINVLSPMLAKLVTPEPQLGLIDFLTDVSTYMNKVIHQTDIERLRILPAGRQNHLANELLASNDMVDLMEEFHSRYNDRLVIIDAPPLIGVNETHTLLHNIDQLLVVVEEGRVKERELRQALKQLPKGLVVHFLLNKTANPRSWKSRKANKDE